MEREDSIWKRNKACALAMLKLSPCRETYWWQQSTAQLAEARMRYPENIELHELLMLQRDGYEQAIIDAAQEL